MENYLANLIRANCIFSWTCSNSYITLCHSSQILFWGKPNLASHVANIMENGFIVYMWQLLSCKKKGSFSCLLGGFWVVISPEILAWPGNITWKNVQKNTEKRNIVTAEIVFAVNVVIISSIWNPLVGVWKSARPKCSRPWRHKVKMSTKVCSPKIVTC